MKKVYKEDVRYLLSIADEATRMMGLLAMDPDLIDKVHTHVSEIRDRFNKEDETNLAGILAEVMEKKNPTTADLIRKELNDIKFRFDKEDD